MSGKRLLPLAALFVLLVIVAIILKRPAPSPTLVEEAALERLVPKTLRSDGVTGLDVYQGAQPDIVLKLRSKVGTWTVASHFDALGNATKIQDFLKQLSALQGELRADSAALHSDFVIADNQALHLRVYTDAPDKPVVHLLAGKGKGSNGFMRRAGEDRVYSVDVNLHTVAGLYGENMSQAPAAKPWLELRLHNIPKEQVTAVEVHAPGRHLRLTQTPTQAPAQEPTTAGTPPAPPASSAWLLATPTLPYALKQDAVDSLVTTLRTLQAEDLADPAKLPEAGLETPTHRAVLTVQPAGQEARHVSLLLGNEVQEGKRYARLGPDGPLYILAQWTWQRLFPALGTLLTAPVFPDLNATQLTALQVQHAGQTWSIERQAESTSAAGAAPSPTWVLAGHPQTPVDPEAVSHVFDTAAQLVAEDILDSAVSGLDAPALEVQVTYGDGRTEQVALGKFPGKDDKTYYVKRQQAAHLFLISSQNYEQLHTALSALHEPQ